MLRIYPVETGEDLKIAKQLLVEYADCLEFDLCFQNFEEELANLPGEYAPPEGCLLIAEYDGEITGCVALRKQNDGVCEMKRLYVKQKFRGLKIGKALAEAIIEQARKAGYTHMRLDFVSPRQAAECLYESLGFKETDAYEEIPIEGAVFMELKLV
ncbi:MAG: GNAT family N-acetyltransferase [Planctomycetota bacterium]|jgi:GNAT superfamily N-acetyltransferase